MLDSKFSTGWNRSVQPRKQRKYRYEAPLHLRQKFMHVHLSPELRVKYGKRNLQIKKGDKIKVLRGQFKKRDGKVEKVNLNAEKIFVTGIEVIKKDGTKILFPLTPSNLMITDLELGDKKRKQKLENKSKKPENKSSAKNSNKKLKNEKSS